MLTQPLRCAILVSVRGAKSLTDNERKNMTELDNKIVSQIENLGLTNNWIGLVSYEDDSFKTFTDWLQSLTQARKETISKMLAKTEAELERTGTAKMPTSADYLAWLNE